MATDITGETTGDEKDNPRVFTGVYQGSGQESGTRGT